MGRGPALTDYEKGVIDGLNEQNLSHQQIADQVCRSRNAVSNYLRSKNQTRSRKRLGRPKKLSERAVRLLSNVAKKPGMTAKKAAVQTGVGVSLRTVQRALSNHPDMVFGKMRTLPALSPKHVLARFKWAEEMALRDMREWRRTLFTDKKRFCLDVSDGSACYWRDARLPPAIFSKRARGGGGGLMVWGGISYRAKTPLVFVSGNMDATAYTTMLENTLEPFISEHYERGLTFQQDGAPAHRANSTKEYFADIDVPLLDWPAHSPDMNVIENCWGHLSRAVYDGARQFDTLDDLREAIIYEWEKLPMTYIRTLINSVPRRVWTLWKMGGRETKY